MKLSGKCFLVTQIIASLLVGCTADIDIVFIIDGSGSIRDANPPNRAFDNWNLLLQFVANIIDRLPRSGTRVGAVVFSDRGQTIFTLDRYIDNLESARNAILNTAYPGANTNTSGGLWVARSQVFSVNTGDRPAVPNLAIVITDGKSTFDNDRTIPYAQDLQRDGVQMISIGITNSVDENELRGLSSPPQIRDRNYFSSPDFTTLGNIIEDLLATACATPAPPTTISKLPIFFSLYMFVNVCPLYVLFCPVLLVFAWLRCCPCLKSLHLIYFILCSCTHFNKQLKCQFWNDSEH